MEILLVLGLAAVAAVLYRTDQARTVVRRHAGTLADATGIPEERIYRDIVARRITPGQWAAEHGLDPMTFEPAGESDTRRTARSHPPAGAGTDRELELAEQAWRRVRLRDTDVFPGLNAMTRVGRLHVELVHLLMSDPPLLAEVRRQDDILVRLHRLGARVDGEWVNDALTRAGVAEGEWTGPREQQAYDTWQRDAVARARDPEMQ